MLFASDFTPLANAVLFAYLLILIAVCSAVGGVVAILIRRWWPVIAGIVIPLVIIAAVAGYCWYGDLRLKAEQERERRETQERNRQPGIDPEKEVEKHLKALVEQKRAKRRAESENFNADKAVWEYRHVRAELDAANTKDEKAYLTSKAKRMEKAWANRQGEDSLYETAFGEPWDWKDEGWVSEVLDNGLPVLELGEFDTRQEAANASSEWHLEHINDVRQTNERPFSRRVDQNKPVKTDTAKPVK